MILRLLQAGFIAFGLLGCPLILDVWADCAVWFGTLSDDTLEKNAIVSGGVGWTSCHTVTGEIKNNNKCFELFVTTEGSGFSLEFERIEP